MDKEKLLKRLAVLDTKDILTKSMYSQYERILTELSEMGVPKPSLTLLREEDRDKPLSCIEEDILPNYFRELLAANHIFTLGELLDINRVRTISFKKFGPSRWQKLYNIQQTLYNSLPHKDVLTGETISAIIENQNTSEFLSPFSKEELLTINKEMLGYERESLKTRNWQSAKYNQLINELRLRGQKRSDAFRDEEIYEVPAGVEDLPVRTQNMLEKSDIELLVQILDLTKTDVLRFPNQGPKSWNNTVELKEQIVDNPDYFVKKYEESYKIHELPENGEGLSLYERCKLALNQLADILENQGKRRSAYLLKGYFIEGVEREILDKNLPYSPGEKKELGAERIRQLLVIHQQKMMSGSNNPLVENAYFSDSLINELESIKEELLYRPTASANLLLQAPADVDNMPILRLLGLNILDITSERKVFLDAPRIIAADDEKGYIALHIKALHYVMAALARPADKDEIIQEVLKSEYLPDRFNLDVIEKVLSTHTWIETDGDKYTYPFELLSTTVTRVARIIYEKKDITTEEIKAIDQQRRNATKAISSIHAASVMAKYPWVAKGAKNDEYIYQPENAPALKPLRVVTEEYAREHVLFKFSDMVRDLRELGYKQYAEGSFRTYVLKFCVPSNKDSNLLCLESEIDKHDKSSWRSRTIQGTTNWIINSCVNILGDKIYSLKDLEKQVLKQPEAINFNVSSIYAYLVNYTCQSDNIEPDKPFISDGRHFWVNKKCLDDGLVNLKTIGFVNKKPDYYMDVMTAIVNSLRDAPGQRMLLKDLRDKHIHLITHPSKGTVFYKIASKLPDEIEKVVIKGDTYLQLRKDRLTLEKTYSMPTESQTSSTDIEIDAPNVIETTKPEKTYVRGKIDWNDMVKELQFELGYYTRWWDVNGISFSDGIDRFVSFLKNSNDYVLRNDLSRHIYEFLTQKVDKYDLYDHLKSISLGLEPILRRMYMNNNQCSSAPITNGLSDCMALIPDLKEWSKYIPSQAQDFKKVYRSYYHVRNKFAHGADIEMNSVSKYQSTYSYLALYIYIFNRFSQ